MSRRSRSSSRAAKAPRPPLPRELGCGLNHAHHVWSSIFTRGPIRQANDVFTIERRGDVTIIVPTNDIERFDPSNLEDAAALATQPIREQESPMVVWDLSQVDYFGSSFLTLLLRSWRVILVKGGQMVLAGVSPRAKELLHITSLDIVWPLYPTRAEAIASLQSD